MVNFIYNADTYVIKVQKDGKIMYKTFRCYDKRAEAWEVAKAWSKNFAKENDLSKDPHIHFRGVWRYKEQSFYHIQYGSSEAALQAAFKYAHEHGDQNIQVKSYGNISENVTGYSVCMAIDGTVYDRIFQNLDEASDFANEISIRHNTVCRPRITRVYD